MTPQEFKTVAGWVADGECQENRLGAVWKDCNNHTEISLFMDFSNFRQKPRELSADAVKLVKGLVALYNEGKPNGHGNKCECDHCQTWEICESFPESAFTELAKLTENVKI